MSAKTFNASFFFFLLSYVFHESSFPPRIITTTTIIIILLILRTYIISHLHVGPRRCGDGSVSSSENFITSMRFFISLYRVNLQGGSKDINCR